MMQKLYRTLSCRYPCIKINLKRKCSLNSLLLQDNVGDILNQQFYPLSLDVVQELDVNNVNIEPVLETSLNNNAHSQISLYINSDELLYLNSNTYGNCLPQVKLQVKFYIAVITLDLIPDFRMI